MEARESARPLRRPLSRISIGFGSEAWDEEEEEENIHMPSKSVLADPPGLRRQGEEASGPTVRDADEKSERSIARECARAYFFVAVWMSISMAVIMFNKWILAYSGFGYPVALTMWHMVFCTALVTVLVRVFKVTNRLKMSRREYARKVMPIGFFYAASLWLSNSA